MVIVKPFGCYNPDERLGVANGIESCFVDSKESAGTVGAITNNLVRVFRIDSDKNQYEGGNGLQITDDGFFVTMYHAIKNYLDELNDLSDLLKKYPKEFQKTSKFKVVDENKVAYLLDPAFRVVLECHDLVLLKMLKPGKTIPVNYAVDLNISQGDSVVYLGREMKTFNPQAKCGDVVIPCVDCEPDKVITEHYDSVLTTILGEQGLSGGVVVKPDGELKWPFEGRLVGFASYVLYDSKDPKKAALGFRKMKYVKQLCDDFCRKVRHNYVE